MHLTRVVRSQINIQRAVLTNSAGEGMKTTRADCLFSDELMDISAAVVKKSVFVYRTNECYKPKNQSRLSWSEHFFCLKQHYVTSKGIYQKKELVYSRSVVPINYLAPESNIVLQESSFHAILSCKKPEDWGESAVMFCRGYILKLRGGLNRNSGQWQLTWLFRFLQFAPQISESNPWSDTSAHKSRRERRNEIRVGSPLSARQIQFWKNV